ncbi:helicase HerA domain-containing protein [Collinsella sp. Sow4_D11]|uniref:ATP-binding protein n=1 Tax=Collinsella sp. Sow4_D11 TaxID=3438775 RepID=UPI003F8EF40F
MGIKSAIVHAADKAGNAVAKVSSLSSEQLEQVEKKREAYLSQKPDPTDATATELTNRLLATAAVEIHGAYLSQLRNVYCPVDPAVEYPDSFNDEFNIRYINIAKWVVDPNEDSLEKLVNVYDVLADENCNIALVFNRTSTNANVYLAVVDTENASDNIDVDNFTRRVSDALKGNFPGSEIGAPQRGSLPCLERNRSYSVATVSNIPTEKNDKFVTQTIEKLLDGIVPKSRAEEYTLVLLATPAHDIRERKLRLAELHSLLTPYASWTTNYTYHQNDSIGSSATIGVNAGVSAGRQAGTNQSVANNYNETDSTNNSQTDSANRGTSQSETTTESITDTESNETNESSQIGATVGGGVGVPFVANSHADLNVNHTQGSSHSTSVAKGTTDAVGKSVSSSLGKAVTSGIGKAVSKGTSVTSGVSKAVNLGANFGGSFARSSTVTATLGNDEGITQTFKNYTIQHALEIIEAQMKRLDLASALGMWDFCAYVLSEDHNVANNVAHTYLALTQGKESFMSQAAVSLWRGDLGENSEDAKAICTYLKDLRHPIFALSPALLDKHPSFSVYPASVTATTVLSGKELAYSLNFPKKSIPGLPVIECAAFGRNVSTFDGTQPTSGLKLGKIFHMHKVEPVRVLLQKDSLASHVFVTGSTGAGKTNTVCRILDEASDQDVKFLVVEPAKGEYKNVYGGRDDVRVFGTNPTVAPLLRINPFSFPESIHVLEHLDRLVEIFNVCWPMYAAMPAVLKDAVSRSYEDCGWDLTASVNPYGPSLYPTFADVARNVREILDESEYDAENKGAYKGSLLTRLNSLTNGLNGMILTPKEVGDDTLFDGNAIVDLSRVGSVETKSLLMGFIVLKLQEHRMASSSSMNQPLRHLTVLEEAHNLLKRTSADQNSESGNLLGKSVEMISNAIAEMRTYGEGFVIADQAPGLLDMAAIRNTNTKIIHRLPDLSDRELAGRAANLNDQQIIELARLPKGVAAVYQNDWVEPVLCKVAKTDDSEPLIYEQPTPAAPADNANVAASIANALIACAPVKNTTALRDIREALDRLDIAASTAVRILRTLQNPPIDPHMTELAPFMSALFPSVKEAVEAAIKRSENPKQWTVAAESELKNRVNAMMGDTVRRAIIQGVITDILYLDETDEAKFTDWYNNGGLV